LAKKSGHFPAIEPLPPDLRYNPSVPGDQATMNDTLELELTGLTYGGNAIGRHEGRAIFVPFGVPGERVRVRITQEKKRFAFADIVDILSPAAERTAPHCAHFQQCGGCQWQHLDYATQLQWKQHIVRDQLARIGGLRDVVVQPTLPSLDPWQYRSHATFQLTPEQRLGFVAVDNRHLIPLAECQIVHPWIAAHIEQQPALPYPARERIRMQIGSEAEGLIFPLKLMEDADEDTGSTPEQRAVTIHIKGKIFRCSAGSFFQVNLPQAERLVEQVLGYLKLRGDERVLDLYAGVGLFSAFLLDAAARVDAIESFGPAVTDAQHNLQAAQERISWHTGRVETLLPHLEGAFDAAVVDPPRAGMESRALDALIDKQPTQIVYVSCDPSTLARDAQRLTQFGYHLREVQPVDMFPQTYHIECVAHFVREL
jgi:23S rRNA (uracil1939-C5)-methyltransferase